MTLTPPEIIAYQIYDNESIQLHSGASTRTWMNETSDRFAYRCLPLAIANATGWELRVPYGFTATWDGGSGVESITITATDPSQATQVERLAQSHFAHGVLTFSTGYIFRTSPDWGILARGAPNYPKHGIYPLDGLMETDWMPFGFTMNWLFTAPGSVEFKVGEPFCFLTPVPHHVLDQVKPIIKPISDDPELMNDNREWSESRRHFNEELHKQNPEIVAQGWQRFYMQGKKANGCPVQAKHVSKRKLPEFKREENN